MTNAAADLAGLVASYARRFHAVIGSRHHVASPLGAWLLLALCAPAASGTQRRELVEVLGCEPEEAAAASRRTCGTGRSRNISMPLSALACG
jgi:hypothetical protein